MIIREFSMGIFTINEKDVNRFINEKDYQGLEKALKYKNNSFIRYKAAEALGRLGNASKIDILLNSLNDNDVEVQKMVIYALGQIGDRKAVLPLISIFNTADNEIKDNILYALGELGGRDAMDSENFMVREKAAHALGEIGEPKTLKYLQNALNDEDPIVQRNAAKAIKNIISKNTRGPDLA